MSSDFIPTEEFDDDNDDDPRCHGYECFTAVIGLAAMCWVVVDAT